MTSFSDWVGSAVLCGCGPNFLNQKGHWSVVLCWKYLALGFMDESEARYVAAVCPANETLHSYTGLKKASFWCCHPIWTVKTFKKKKKYQHICLMWWSNRSYGRNCLQKKKKNPSFFSHMRGMAGVLVYLMDPSHTPSPTIRHTNTITHCSCLEVEILTRASYSIIEIYCAVRRLRSSLWALFLTQGRKCVTGFIITRYLMHTWW